MTALPLNELQHQQVATIYQLKGSRALRQRLAAIGILKGQPVSVKASTPWNGPRVYRIGQHQFCLRPAEACQIEVVLADVAHCG